MRKSIMVLAVLVAVAAGVAGAATRGVISIGAVISLTSVAGAMPDGEGVRDGLRLAVDEINARGGVNRRKVELYVEDARNTAEGAVAAFEKLEKARRPLLYVSTLATPTLAIAPKAGDAGVVLFGLINATTGLTAVNDWTYRYWSTSVQSVPVFLAELRSLKAGSVGLLYRDDDFGRSLAGALKPALAGAGLSLRAEPFTDAQPDLRPALGRLQDPDALVLISQTALMPAQLEQIRASGFRGAVLANTGVTESSILALPQAQGVYSYAPIIFNPRFVYARDLAAKYQAAYRRPLGFAAAAGYDLVRLVANLMEDQDVDRDTLKARLQRGFVHVGVFGDVRLHQGERELQIPLYPVRVVDGTLQYLEGAGQ